MSNKSSLIIYTTDDGLTNVDVTFDNETVWLNQEQMADLFQKAKSTINEHIKNIYEEGELNQKETMRKFGNSEFSTKPTNDEYVKYKARTLSDVEKDYLNSIKSLDEKIKNN